MEGSLRAGCEVSPRLSHAGRSLGFALGIWALGVCAVSSAEARIETISWIHNNPTAVDGFRIYARYEGEGYRAPFYEGLPVPQGGVYSVSFDVDDNEVVYFVGTAYNELTESAFSNEIVRLAPVCGDGTVDPGEVCDDGNTANGDGCDAACRIEPEPACGDGAVDSGEQCDDGNTTGGDGCRSNCTLELCGDGIHDPSEQCDDGNTANGDGCDATCRIEPEPACGDGILDPGEQCDDGNTMGYDGCDESCQIEEIEPPQLLANPDFDDTLQLANWGAIDPGVPPEWIPIDVDEIPNSGSALIENPYAGGVGTTGLEPECVPVTEGADYEWSSWGVRTNSERGQRSRLLVGVAWYADPSCNDREFQQAMASQSLNSGKWTEVAGRATAPPGSVGAVVRVMTLMDAASSSESLIAQVDGIALFRVSASSRGRGPRNRK